MKKNGISIISPFMVEYPLDVKSTALFFDKIFVQEDLVETMKRTLQEHKHRTSFNSQQVLENIRETEYLIDCHFFETKTVDKTTYNEEEQTILERYNEILDILEFPIKKYDIPDLFKEKDVLALSMVMSDLLTRLALNDFVEKGADNIFPIYQTRWFEGQNANHDILHFTLDKLPVPDDRTSWEQIMDFRNDKDSISKYYALVHWANQVASTNRPLHEIEDEYNYLYSEYNKAFSLHSMKSSLTTWQILVTGSIDALMLAHGFGSVVSTLFSIGKARIELKEEEMKLPGREIAYIHKANETFNRQLTP